MLIGEYQKNKAERVRVSINDYKGNQFVDVRAYFQDKEGIWRPTKKGIAVPPQTADELIALIRKAVEAMAA